jgi:hypothetical protein
MPDKDERKIIPSQGGIFSDLVVRIKLVLRLLADSRVSPFLKLIPVGSLVYFIFPDLIPGPIEDAAVIWLGAYLFVELCPPEVVEEHIQELTQSIPGELRDVKNNQGDVIDAEFWEHKENHEEKEPPVSAGK